MANTDTQGMNTVVDLWDAQTGTNVLASADVSNAVPVSGPSYAPLVDPSGRYVIFLSYATNLTTNALTGGCHLYCRDTELDSTVLVDANTNGVGVGVDPAGYPDFCPGSRLLTFESDDAQDRNHYMNVLVCNLQSNATELASIQSPAISSQSPDGPSVLSSTAAVSLNGQYVAFASDADNLVPNDTNGFREVFVRDLNAGTNILVSADTNGLPAAGVSSEASISGNGQYVVFSSSAASLAPGDANNAVDVFERNLQLGTTTLVSENLSHQGSGNGVGSGSSGSFASQWGWSFSADGSLLVYQTSAAIVAMDTNLVNDVYLYAVVAKTNLLVSQNLTGTGAGDGASDSPVISPDGRFVAYRSAADNLVPGDSNGVPDVFIYDRTIGTTTLVSPSQFGTGSGDNRSLLPLFSGDGQTLVFESAASDLVTNDWNRTSDLFALNLYEAGLSSTYYIQIVPLVAPGLNPTLTWPVQPGKTYQVQFKNNLTDPAWQTLPGNVSILGNTGSFTDPTPPSGQRFYQIVGQ